MTAFMDRLDRRMLNRILAVAVIVFVLLLPFFFDSGSGFIEDSVSALIYVVMALGLNIVVGFAGLLDLGYVAFFAIGAYSMGWFGSSFFGGANVHIGVTELLGKLPGIHLNYLLIIPLAALLAAFFGAVLGAPTLRLRGDYIAIVTLAFGEIVGRVAVNSDDGVFGIGHFNLTNGRRGITPVDKIDLPFADRFTTLNLRPWFWTALAMALVVVFINIRLRDSRLGRAWIAVREDEVAAVSMGVPMVKVKLYAYALGAMCGGVAGSFLASFVNTVNADQFEFSFSIFILAMIILGGLGQHLGRHRRRRRAVVHQHPPDPRRARRGAGEDRPGLRPHPARVRDLRLPARDHDDPASAGHDPRGAPQGRADRGHRLRRGERLRGARVSENGEPILETMGLTKIFGGLTAVDDVSFAVTERSIATIIGPNGAGKTTFFNMLTGLYKPTFGRVLFRGARHHLAPAGSHHRAGHRAHLPEHPPVRHHDR